MSETVTLEQELSQLIEGTDYLVRFGSTSYLHVSLHYRPAVVVSQTQNLVLHNGEFASKLFRGRRRYRKAAKWIRTSVAEHQRMVASIGGVRISP